MEDSSSRRAGSNGGLPRSTFAENFFGTDPFNNFDPAQPTGGFPRRFTERSSRFFDDDLDRFFGDGFTSAGGAHPFRDEPSLFRSSMSSNRRSPFTSSSSPSSNSQHGGGMERPIHVQRQQTVPTTAQQQPSPTMERKMGEQHPPTGFQHHRSKSHYDNADDGYHQQKWDQQQPNRFSQYANADSADQQQRFAPRYRQFPSQQQQQQHPNDPNVHVINIRQESPIPPRNGSRQQFVEINNAQPNYSNGALNPDKRRRFSNARPPANERKNMMKNVSRSIPDITIEDYGDGKRMMDNEGEEGNEQLQQQQSLPTVIPLPAPAIPLPAPDGMMMAAGKREEKDEETWENGQKDGNEVGIRMMEEPGGKKYKKHIEIANDDDMEQMARVKMVHDDDDDNVGNTNSNFVPLADNGEQLIRMLDETEQQVESLRETATRVEVEKETILDRIENIKLSGKLIRLSKDDRDELALNADRILTRCKAVDVCVNTPRDEHQSRALEQVDQVIKSVTDRMQENLPGAKIKLLYFLNACNPDEIGHIDEKFQSLIIACTADDQKKIRRRLTQLIEKIERTQSSSH